MKAIKKELLCIRQGDTWLMGYYCRLQQSRQKRLGWYFQRCRGWLPSMPTASVLGAQIPAQKCIPSTPAEGDSALHESNLNNSDTSLPTHTNFLLCTRNMLRILLFRLIQQDLLTNKNEGLKTSSKNDQKSGTSDFIQNKCHPPAHTHISKQEKRESQLWAPGPNQ